MSGTQAKKRFQTRNVYRWSCVAWICATSVPIESTDAASSESTMRVKPRTTR